MDGDKVEVFDLRSANGTFVNGRQVRSRTPLALGDRLDIGPFCLEFDGETLVSRSRSENVELAARELRRAVVDSGAEDDDARKTVIDDVSLVIRPHEFVAILGPTGSGKTTLLQLLSGRIKPDAGSVEVNGDDLSRNLAVMKDDIAFLPSQPALHGSLTVRETLAFVAKLRLLPDTTSDEIDRQIDAALETTGLADRRDVRIDALGAGEVRHVELAGELLCRPSLLFLDEPTGGLDQESDRQTMEMLRRIADGGMTVVCATKTPANVEANCHLVAILVAGGRLAFFGSPREAKEHFGVDDLGDIHATTARADAKGWQTSFRASEPHRRYVKDRMTAALSRPAKTADDSAGRTAVDPWRQGWTLAMRHLAVWRGNPAKAMSAIATSLLLAIALGLAFGTSRVDVDGPGGSVNLLFLMSIACFWLGCSNAAEEIVQERVQFLRDSDRGVRKGAYLASKLCVLLLIGAAEVVLLFAIVKIWCAPFGSFLGQISALFAVMASGTTLGLLLSALARTRDAALRLIPIVMIPQILFAGIVAPPSGLARTLGGAFVTCFWGTSALEALLPEETAELLGIAPSAFAWQLGVVLLHAIVFFAAAYVILRMRSNSGRAQ